MTVRTIPALAALLHLSVFSNCFAFAEEGSKGLTASKAWARATPGGATIGAAYLEIAASDATGDKLTAVSSPVAGRAEVHTHAEVDGVMKMRRLEAIDIPAGMAHVLAPGGDHIMLFDLKRPLMQGESFPLTLSFEKAGEIKLEAKVLWFSAKGPDEPGPKAKAGAAAPGSEPGSESGLGSESGSGH